MKPKVINGQELTGPMLCDLIKSYVSSFNSGSVPNIESAWTSICQSECQKYLVESVNQYETEISQRYETAFPMSEKDFSLIHQESLDLSIIHLTQNSIGEDVEVYLSRLKEETTKIFSRIETQNEIDSKELINSYLSEQFGQVEQRLRGEEFEEFNEYDNEI